MNTSWSDVVAIERPLGQDVREPSFEVIHGTSGTVSPLARFSFLIRDAASLDARPGACRERLHGQQQGTTSERALTADCMMRALPVVRVIVPKAAREKSAFGLANHRPKLALLMDAYASIDGRLSEVFGKLGLARFAVVPTRGHQEAAEKRLNMRRSRSGASVEGSDPTQIADDGGPRRDRWRP